MGFWCALSVRGERGLLSNTLRDVAWCVAWFRTLNGADDALIMIVRSVTDAMFADILLLTSFGELSAPGACQSARCPCAARGALPLPARVVSSRTVPWRSEGPMSTCHLHSPVCLSLDTRPKQALLQQQSRVTLEFTIVARCRCWYSLDLQGASRCLQRMGHSKLMKLLSPTSTSNK